MKKKEAVELLGAQKAARTADEQKAATMVEADQNMAEFVEDQNEGEAQ